MTRKKKSAAAAVIEATPERFVDIVEQAKAHVHPATATLTNEQLMECLAEGQACVMDFATTSIHLDRRARFPEEAGGRTRRVVHQATKTGRR